MYSINELLDLAKEKNTDLKSDRRLAMALGVTDLSHYRKRNVAPNDATATRLAELCGLSPEVVIAACHAAKAETPETRRAWKNIYDMASHACVIATVAFVFHLNETAIIPAIKTISYITGSGGMDIMSSYALIIAGLFFHYIRYLNKDGSFIA